MMKAMKTARKMLLGRPLSDSISTTPTTQQSGQSNASITPPANASKEINLEQKIPLYCFEALPGMFFGNTEEEEGFFNYAKCMSSTYFHASGTCAMETDRCGREITDVHISSCHALNDSSSVCDGDNGCVCDNNMSVVDVNLRVRGVSNLRVGDASVFPRIPSGPTSATCMAIAVSLAKLILESASQ